MSNPAAYELFPSLATKNTTERDCYVRDGVTSTFVVPGDWVSDDEAAGWVGTYDKAILGETQSAWGNEVEFFVNGAEGFAAIGQEVRAALSAPETSFVCHAGWTCVLKTGGFGDGTTYFSMMKDLAVNEVLTTTLYWYGSLAASKEGKRALTEAHEVLRKLPGDAVQSFLDNETRRFGCHHQKIWVILGPKGLSAYFGGLDVHPNRIEPSDDFDDPYHDVHARVRGPAAERLLGIFLWRLIASGDWSGRTMPAPEATSDTTPPELQPSEVADVTSHLGGPVIHAADGPPTNLFERYERTHAIYRLWEKYRSGSHAQRTFGGDNPARVRVGQTIGNPRIASANYKSEIGTMVRNGIERARRFVYLEDQYFWHLPTAQLLGNRIRQGDLKQLIIVTNLSLHLAEHPPNTGLALQHLAYAARGHTDKILVFERVGTHGRYVHSKMWVFDDVSALVGSANCNMRGYTHDSESAGVWIDRVSPHTPWHAVGSTLARKLRVKLWQAHLNVQPRILFDGLGASTLWYDVAEQSSPALLSDGFALPRVAPVMIDATKWSQWAKQQGGADPPGDVSVLQDHLDGVEWLIDPSA